VLQLPLIHLRHSNGYKRLDSRTTDYTDFTDKTNRTQRLFPDRRIRVIREIRGLLRSATELRPLQAIQPAELPVQVVHQEFVR